jgi:hypothetical protein
MLTDLDKLPHGPEWSIREIKIMDGERPRVQYMFVRPIIPLIREMLVNPAFKGRMKWAPERHYTSPDKKVRVHSNMWTTNWWWRMQVSILRHSTGTKKLTITFRRS